MLISFHLWIKMQTTSDQIIITITMQNLVCPHFYIRIFLSKLRKQVWVFGKRLPFRLPLGSQHPSPSCFHWRRSLSRSRSRKSAFDQMKIENWSRKWCHKLARIVVRRIRTVPFTSASSHDSKAYDPVKTELSEPQAEVKNTSITMRVLRSSDRF